MTKNGRKLLDTLYKLTDESLYSHSYELSLLCRHAKTYHRIQENRCNGHPLQGSYNPPPNMGELQDRFDAWLDRREALLERRIKELAGAIPGVVGVKFGGDPRGAVVKLVLANGRTDDWGQEGVCIPY